MMLPEYQHLKTVRQLCDEFPHLFTEGSLRWWIFRRTTNGFDRCIVRIGRRLYIDSLALKEWLAEHRGLTAEGTPGGRQTAAATSPQHRREGASERSVRR